MCVALHFMLCKLINARKDVVINLRTKYVRILFAASARCSHTEHRTLDASDKLASYKPFLSLGSAFASATHKIVLVVVAVLGVVFVVRA